MAANENFYLRLCFLLEKANFGEAWQITLNPILPPALSSLPD
jgi:hypothetical protein